MYFLLRSLSKFSSWMGPRGWKCWGTVFGTLLWWFLPSQRRTVLLDNIRIALKMNEKATRQLARENCCNMGILILEALAMPKLNKDNVREWFQIEGEEYLQEALSEGRGIIFATAHLGNWEWLGAALGLLGYPIVAVMTPQHNQAVNNFIMELRSGAGMILNMRADVRDMVRHLKAGHMVGLLIDQYAPQSTIELEFFWRKTRCQPGAAVLGRMQKAPIVPGFIHRRPDGKHQIKFYPVMHIDETQEKNEAQVAITETLIRITENEIRLHPAEWFWLHDRWKTVGRERRTTD